ncbi:acyl-homoserine-lactone synthase [Roseibium sp.]|uniref:acyl-homoserine-lactone synthase n=1 Tax=Roseibium sp. TaxID=1936156 RepID=UPI003263AA29
MAKTVYVSWNTIHLHNDLWLQHLKLRKQLFVDEKGWSIPHTEDLEWDQYDTGLTRYLLTIEGDRVLAASRLNPCNYACATSSYMIRDAVLGRLPEIPDTLLTDPPCDDYTWEATRFTVDPTLSQDERSTVLAENANAMKRWAVDAGAQRLIMLMHPAFMKWLKKNGVMTRPLGPTVVDAEGNRMCVLEWNRPTSGLPLPPAAPDLPPTPCSLSR